jgi:hypothetical protein
LKVHGPYGGFALQAQVFGLTAPFRRDPALVKTRLGRYIPGDAQRASALNRPQEFAMAGMDDRKDAFEKKFAHDEALQFKATARRNKMLGLWAAEKLGKSAEDAEAYAKSVVMADFEEAGDDDVLRKIKADLAAGGVEQSDHQIRRTMDELMAQAVEDIRAKG